MRFDVLTLFPAMFHSFLEGSIVAKAIKKDALEVSLVDFRDFTFLKSRQVDDYPYGGEAGMVIKPEPVFRAVEFLQDNDKSIPLIYFTPQGRPLTQAIVKQYAKEERVMILCGHYKDVDQRVRDTLVTDEISLGDYVLSGGELPAMCFIDACARLQPGVLKDIESANSDSFEDSILGYPYYTRPVEYQGMKVPEVLLSGNHKKIQEWRKQKALELTRQRRSDLLDEK
ncbi:MAG: tRNA (guanosine(37)-N1)-methyltransferase TrmD [Candidatus Zophobacter franzmannii]|nr:tRNA (guanosine(37)-N1)-methyltransferase TrmD [Candidatus Zophobacter franzmannii]